MKNTIKFLAVLTVFFGMFSCTDDDNSDAGSYANGISTTTVNVTATLSTVTTFTNDEDNFDVTLTIDSTYPSDATMRLKFEYDDTRVLTKLVTIPAGSTSVTTDIQLPSDNGISSGNVTFLNNAASLIADGFTLADPVAGTDYTVSSNTLEFDLYDRVPVRDENSFGFVFDWSNSAGNDLDLYLYETSTFTVVDAQFTGSRFEVTSLLADATVGDGTYSVAFEVWTATDTSVDYKVLLRNTDNTTVYYEDTISPIAAGDFIFPDVAVERTVTKTTTTSTDPSIPDTVTFTIN